MTRARGGGGGGGRVGKEEGAQVSVSAFLRFCNSAANQTSPALCPAGPLAPWGLLFSEADNLGIT